LGHGLEQLSSALRLNRAADDAAGLAIAERLRTAVRELEQESSNFQSGISLAQTAEGGLAAQSDIVGRARELAVQASNGTLTEEQRAVINEEAQQLVQQIDDTAHNTEFNETGLLDGSTPSINLDAGGSVQVNLEESTAASLGIAGVDLSTQAGAAAAIEALDDAAQTISTNRANLGAQQNRLSSAIAQREISAQNAIEAESRIRDLDIARATIEQTRDQTLLQAGLSAIAQGNLQRQTATTLLGG
jgi:flagellin